MKPFLNRTLRALLTLFVVHFSILGGGLNAQYGTSVEVRNVDFWLRDDVVVIKYDLVKAKSTELFDIDVNVINTSDFHINASTLSGQFQNVKRGRKKEIIWHIGEDYPSFQDNVYVEVVARHTNYRPITRISKFEGFCLSTIWPGWGSAQTKLKDVNYMKGVFAYGFLATGLILHEKYQYTNVPNSLEFEKVSNEQWYKLGSYASFGMAGMIWILEYYKVLFTPNISKKIQMDFQAQYEPMSKSPALAFKMTF